MSDFIKDYELITPWRDNLASGSSLQAVKDGKKYIFKRYETPEPIRNEGMSEATYQKNKDRFEKLKNYRTKVNQALRHISDPTIVSAVEEFVHEHRYIEVTPFVTGALDTMEVASVVSNLPAEQQANVIRTALRGLELMHKEKVVHSDLKLSNILVVEDSSSEKKYSSKIIDFDGSFIVDDKGDGYNCTEHHMSPEQALFYYAEDKEDQLAALENTDEKTDIFSLGLIFHELLSGGDLPDYVDLAPHLQRDKEAGNPVYAACAIYYEAKPLLSPRIKNPFYKAMIYDMLERLAVNRPSAKELIEFMDACERGKTLIDEPWPSDNLEFIPDAFKLKGYMQLKRTEEGKYLLRKDSGEKEIVDSKQIISLGLGKEPLEIKFDAAWEEHKIEINPDALKTKGYIALHRVEVSGIKAYRIYDSRKVGYFRKPADLIISGFAKAIKDPLEPIFDKPWEEHSAYEFDEAKIIAAGYVSLRRASIKGLKAYYLFDKNEISRLNKIDDLVVLGYATKKMPEGGFDEPWEEHSFTFNIARIKSAGYNAVERAESSGQKVYRFYHVTGREQIRTAQEVIALKYGIPK